ncbi:hypothetical protein M422DRAFT_70812 [Sphaerobolus stellatus SS14]|uniref:DDE Tnp4 domain-containing protein n=1 Tax=Sphaerobolus stellatus (strain SS14) TaxID=990650 RepID=A0A0C9UB30_SPHS4|nr:hypothetical protein M422DRAFT_70812 [Sphaerobolus stellatus SS14]
MDLDQAGSDVDSDSSLSSLSTLSSLSSTSTIANDLSTDSEFGGGMDWAGDGMFFNNDNEEQEEEERHNQRMQAIHRHLTFILTNRVLEPNFVHKQSQLHLILVLYKEDDPKRFRRNLRASPLTFDAVLSRIIEHPVFFSQGPKPQMPVQYQLAISLFRFGHFGNAASVESIAQWAGVSAGQVVKCTRRIMIAFASLHDKVMRWATADEKAEAKSWVGAASCPAWRHGFAMVDGTLVPLAEKPGFHGEAYFDRKSNYSLSVQVRIRSEHAMGLLKGRFQSLKGLRQQIKDERDHRLAIEWIRTCLIIHTLIHDVEEEMNTHDRDFDELLIEIGLAGGGEVDNGNDGAEKE